MPPRRRTFYLADATLLSNSKVGRLRRRHPDDWLAAVGAFHLLIGIATLNDDPRFTDDECADIIGDQAETLVPILRTVGMMNAEGLDPYTFEEWKPRPRPKYPSDSAGVHSDSAGVHSDSAVVPDDSAVVETNAAGNSLNGAEKTGVPTSTSSSSSTTTTASSPRQGKADARELNRQEAKALHEAFLRHEITEMEYERRRQDIGKEPDDLTRWEFEKKAVRS